MFFFIKNYDLDALSFLHFFIFSFLFFIFVAKKRKYYRK